MRKIQYFTRPDLSIVRQARELEIICKAHDNLGGSLYLDPSLNISPDVPCLITLHEDDRLIGLLTFFLPTIKEAELVAMTHPDFRRSGVFFTLAAAAAKQAAALNVPDLLFVCEPQSQSGTATLAALGAALDYSEYSLRYDRSLPPERLAVPEGLTLHRAASADLNLLTHINAVSFQESEEYARVFLARALESDTRRQYFACLNGEPVAMGAVGLDDGETTVFGLGVLPGHQGKGVGRGVLALILREITSSSEDEILIEVDSTNAPALHLYLSSGFSVESTFGYYRMQTDRLLNKISEMQP